jgi:DNA-binding LytR/AlgR family response regulator
MRVLIVDDEAIARQILREHLEEIPRVEIAGEAATGIEATELAAALRPDVLLLDLQMPEMGGFAVARSLNGAASPVIIYVTAFQEHALEGFETGAADYLLKPVRRERLEGALEKAARLLAGLKTPEAPVPKRIVGKLGDKSYVLALDDIIAFQADAEVVYIVTANARYFADSPLRILEQRLPVPRFRRVHRKTLINTDHIRSISSLPSKRWLLKMSNGLEVVVSKRQAGGSPQKWGGPFAL